ncbi:hypothetical protein HPB47_026947, partial [Ixodes persulcatus]
PPPPSCRTSRQGYEKNFLPAGYEPQILRELEARTQHPEERVGASSGAQTATLVSALPNASPPVASRRARRGSDPEPKTTAAGSRQMGTDRPLSPAVAADGEAPAGPSGSLGGRRPGRHKWASTMRASTLTLAVLAGVLGAALAGYHQPWKPDEIVKLVHKVVPYPHPVPVPKPYPVPKIIHVPHVVHVPHPVPVPVKVPVIKKIPKLVPVYKSIPVPKPVPVPHYVSVGVPVPVIKHQPVPIYKHVPVPRVVPVPVPVKVPKYVPVPVHKIIHVPRPVAVPVKVPVFKEIIVKKPVEVPVPVYIKKTTYHGAFVLRNSARILQDCL